MKAERQKQLDLVQREQYNTKLQIWELKNEVLELKESIREEKEEGERLAAELQEDEREDREEADWRVHAVIWMIGITTADK